MEKSLESQVKKQAKEDGTDKESKMKRLEENMKLNRDEANEWAKRFPKTLDYNIEPNLAPKLDFYKEVIGDEQSAISLVMKHPRNVFCSSLESRLKPRLKEAQELGIDINEGLVRRMAVLTDEKWKKSLAYQAKKQQGK